MIAKCPILFVSTGGQLDERGRPIYITARAANGQPVLVPAGNPEAVAWCERAYDCGVCPHLHKFLNTKIAEGWAFGWECDRCLKVTKELDAGNGVERKVTGIYQAGRKFGISSESNDYDPDAPGLEGCTHIHEFDDPEVDKRAGEKCGWETSFLQLVLRRRKNG